MLLFHLLSYLVLNLYYFIFLKNQNYTFYHLPWPTQRGSICLVPLQITRCWYFIYTPVYVCGVLSDLLVRVSSGSMTVSAQVLFLIIYLWISTSGVILNSPWSIGFLLLKAFRELQDNFRNNGVILQLPLCSHECLLTICIQFWLLVVCQQLLFWRSYTSLFSALHLGSYAAEARVESFPALSSYVLYTLPLQNFCCW